jgi:hypothetical protein
MWTRRFPAIGILNDLLTFAMIVFRHLRPARRPKARATAHRAGPLTAQNLLQTIDAITANPVKVTA